jgi:PTS system mannose-specific IIA component
MVGAVIITHGRLAEALLVGAVTIVGTVERVMALCVKGEETSEDIKQMLQDALVEVSDGEGVVIFTDMFGGTPSNISLSLLDEGVLEVITGVNLPLIIKFLSSREGRTLDELAPLLIEYGRKSIVLASEMLKQSNEKEKDKK